MEIIVNNITRTRKFGWGYSTTPERQGTRIIPPTSPDYTGTLDSLLRTINADRTYNSMVSGGTYISTRWFYAGREIIGYVESGSTNPDAFAWLLERLDWEREYARQDHKPYTPPTITLIVAD